MPRSRLCGLAALFYRCKLVIKEGQLPIKNSFKVFWYDLVPEQGLKQELRFKFVLLR